MSTDQAKALALQTKINLSGTETLTDDEITQLSQLLSSISLSSQRDGSQLKEPRVNDPRTFNGSNQDGEGYNKLENFITQLKMGGGECVPASEEFLEQLRQTQDKAKANITKAQSSQASYYNQGKRQIENLKVGDEVYINSKHIATSRPMKKLDHKRLGPFKIIEKISSHAYKLKLPTSVKVHPTFHISKLTPRSIKGLDDFDNREQPPAPPIIVNSNEEFEVDQILDSRIYRNKLQYKVKWKGYEDPSEDTWEDQENLENAKLATKQFHQDYPHKPSPASIDSRTHA